MQIISNKLAKLGFDRWFQDRIDPKYVENFEIARVITVHKERYIIAVGDKVIPAELAGKLLFSAASPLDYPAVGDWVYAMLYDNNTFSIINGRFPRKTLLKRKTPGKQVDFQLIAANIDTAFIVQSLDDNFNLRRLERYLVMVHESSIRPVALLSKSDLLSSAEIADRINRIHRIMPDLKVVPFSNLNEADLENIHHLLEPGLTYCLLGSSGVGKTSLLNRLAGDTRYKTATVREKDSKGRHATTHRQLIQLDLDAMVVDTPGMRELGNISVDTGIDETFSEIAALSEKCRFNDCTHDHEKDCAVLQALEDGRLSEKRYRNYIKMNRESAYNEMSYLDKKRKDRQFGKYVKTVMKHKKAKQ